MAEYIEREDAKVWIANVLSLIPSTDVVPVVRCKDCARRPYFDPPESEDNCDLVFPDDWNSLCPYFCEDIWYASMPKDNWFCCFGKRKDSEA